MPARNKPTLRQVASVAKVSPATASMILNDKDGVSFNPDTVQRVKTVAEQLGYISAPLLRGKPAGIFQKKVIVTFNATVTGYYYTSLIQAIEQTAQKAGYDAVCFQTYHSAARELNGISIFSGSDIAGIVFTYVPHNYKMLEALSHDIPIVIIGDHNEMVRLDMVETNNYAAGMMMARHILQLGHRSVAFLNDRFEWQGYPTSTRLRGVQTVFEQEYPEATLHVLSSTAVGELVLGDYMARRDIGFRLAQECLAKHGDVTAIMCVTDMVAYGALDLMAKEGLRVPADYSVCGFDNNFAADLLGLTTHDHHVYEIGTNAFNLLQRRMQATESLGVESITKVELIGEIVARTSTALPRQ